MAPRHFAGGSPVDVLVVHKIFHCEVFTSAWMVVDAVNQCNFLAMTFPTRHAEQQQLCC
jgi:hypothetical protein